MEARWRSFGNLLGRRWPIVVAALLLATVVLGVGARSIEFATGQDSYLDSSSQTAIDNELFQDTFGGETIIVLFRAEDGVPVTELVAGPNLAALEQLEADLRAIPEVHSVVLPLTSLRFSEGIVTSGAGTGAVTRALARESDPEGQALRQADLSVTLARLPEADRQRLDDPAWSEFLVYGNDGVTVVDGEATLPAPDERVIRSSLRSTFPTLSTAVGGVLLTGNADLDTLSAGTEAVVDAVEAIDIEGFEVVVTGSPLFLKEINDYLQGGMVSLGAIAFAVMAVVLGVLFRVRRRFLPLVSTALGVVWGFSLLGYLGIDLSLVTISGLPILIGLGIDFAIQVQNRIEEEAVHDRETEPVAETLANVGPALVVATLAAVVAFTALQVSRVPMIRDFGVLLSLGIVALVIAGIILPATVFGARHSRKAPVEDGGVERVVAWLGSAPPKAAVPLVALSVVLFASGVALEGRFEVESDPIRWIDQSSQTVADLDVLEEDTGFSSTLGVLVSANNVLADEVTEVVHGFLLDAEATEDVASTSSLVGTMAKVIEVPGATRLAPVADDLQAAAAVLPPDIAKVLLAPDGTATQLNLRLAPASLDERAVLVERLEADLAERIDSLELADDSVLAEGLGPDDAPVRAVPAGLAVVGVALLDNLSANRAVLTYLGLALSALFLLLRFRSLGRAVLTLVPVGLAIGTSSAVVGAFGLTLSPLTTVSGPLVIASCTEFSVLITARYLEERQAGLVAGAASDRAARRTGRAFFTSAATTIGGFAVLIGSALPLLRDFGIIVTMNVTVALLAALVVMPPLLVWADDRGLFPIGDVDPSRAVKLAAKPEGARLTAWVAAIAVVGAIAAALFASAERDSGDAVELAYVPVALPTTTTTTTAPPSGPPSLDDFPAERPAGLVDGVVFDLLTAQGADPRAANCTGATLLAGTPEADVIALASGDQPALFALVRDAATTCGVPEDVIAAAEAAGL